MTQLEIPRSAEALNEPSESVSTSTPSLKSRSEDPSTEQRKDENCEPRTRKPSVPLQRTVYPVGIVLIYSAAALYAWVIICILSHRPIGGKTYGIEALEQFSFRETVVGDAVEKFFHKSEKHLRAARVVQAFVTAVTVPLTSAICSQAAVVYMQRKRWGKGLSLRQGMALADKGWTDISLIGRLISGGWKKYSSLLLCLALLLHLLGFAISPVQQLFLSYKTVRRPNVKPEYLGSVTDIPALFPDFDLRTGSSPYYDSGLDTVKLRSILTSTTNNEVNPRLWSRDNGNISSEDRSEHSGVYELLQTKSQNMLVNISTINDPFWAQLPSSTKTGMVRQFAPRINSTAIFGDNPDHKLPGDCHPSSSALYFNYKYHYKPKEAHWSFGYDIEVCMPGNVSVSPWKNQRRRQDITEELYIRMNFTGDGDRLITDSLILPGLYSRKLTLKSTLGYFELPNYENSNFPGPLLDRNPFPTKESEMFQRRSMDNETLWNILDQTDKILENGPRGPLLAITLALFGEGSFADIDHTAMAAYARSNATFSDCIGAVPLIPLLGKNGRFGSRPFDPCLRGDSVSTSYWMNDDEELQEHRIAGLHTNVGTYFSLISGSRYAETDEQVQNAFAASAFLANDMMMTNPTQISPNIYIDYTFGVDMQIPSISTKGIAFISVLLAIDLLCLLAMALYSAWNPRWTTALDSFAMMRIGASVSEKVPLLATNHAERIKALDELPGWMGNTEEGKRGQLCLGGQLPLDKTKFYIGYETDRQTSSSTKKQTKKPIKRGGYTLASV